MNDYFKVRSKKWEGQVEKSGKGRSKKVRRAGRKKWEGQVEKTEKGRLKNWEGQVKKREGQVEKLGREGRTLEEQVKKVGRAGRKSGKGRSNWEWHGDTSEPS